MHSKSPAHIKYDEFVNDKDTSRDDIQHVSASPTLNREQVNENVFPQSEISAATDPLTSDLEK